GWRDRRGWARAAGATRGPPTVRAALAPTNAQVAPAPAGDPAVVCWVLYRLLPSTDSRILERISAVFRCLGISGPSSASTRLSDRAHLRQRRRTVDVVGSNRRATLPGSAWRALTGTRPPWERAAVWSCRRPAGRRSCRPSSSPPRGA